MGEVLAKKLIDALDTAKRTTSLDRLIAALGIRHVGTETARTLANTYHDLAALSSASQEELQTLRDVGPEVAISIRQFFAVPANQKLVQELAHLGLHPTGKKDSAVSAGSPLAGKTILFTGSLSMPRNQAQRLAEAAGCVPVSGVSKKLGYLVVGENPGSKLTKAQALGIPVLDEREFLDMLNEVGISSTPKKA